MRAKDIFFMRVRNSALAKAWALVQKNRHAFTDEEYKFLGDLLS